MNYLTSRGRIDLLQLDQLTKPQPRPQQSQD